jgi:hypothetical protein
VRESDVLRQPLLVPSDFKAPNSRIDIAADRPGTYLHHFWRPLLIIVGISAAAALFSKNVCQQA